MAVAKEKLLIYSDCYVYGGSERLLAFIILNPAIRENYEIHFIYRKHSFYETGLKEDYGSERTNFHPLLILSSDTIYYKINKSSLPNFLKKIIKFPFWCLQKLGVYALYNFFIMKAAIKKIKPQIIHINNGGYPGAASCIPFILAARANKIKKIVYQVNNIAYLPKTKIAEWIDRKVVDKNVQYFITASLKAKEALVKNRKFLADKIIPIPNTTFSNPFVKKKDDVLKEFSWSADIFLLCEVGLLVKRKGQIFLLEAINKIKFNNPLLFKNLRLVLVGDGEEEHSLKQFVLENDLANNVVLVGHRADRLNFINACDILVLPSIANEDMPIVILEAMNLGKTIIASNFAGIKEEIENGVSGILIEPNIETLSLDIAEAIIKIYSGKDLNIYGINAKKRFNEFFSIEHYGARLIKAYDLMNK